MSNSTDAHLVRGPVCLCITILAVLLSAGCSQQQQAVDLYVDAVMFKELNENEMAVEKLNSAVQLNKRFSLAYSLLGEIYQEIKTTPADETEEARCKDEFTNRWS